jgi:hypothetical protein
MSGFYLFSQTPIGQTTSLVMIKRFLNCRPARLGLGLASLAVATLLPAAEPKITPTKDIIGFTVGDDYVLANYTQLSALLQKWDAESDRLKVVSYGTSEEGRPMYMAIISSPPTSPSSSTTARFPSASRWPTASTRPPHVSSPRRARRSSGSTVACTPRKPALAGAQRLCPRDAQPDATMRSCVSSTT